jgi:Zn-dependent M28 family amino/carboxypeptidase
MLSLIALVLAAPPPDLAQRGEAGLAAIRASALSAHVRFLADDLLEGRGTGTRGHAVAARYLATQLQALGYEPAGERGTWFQDVPLIGMTVMPEDCALEVDGARLRYGDDVLFAPRAGSASDDVAGELVFAGYGVSAPEYRYDDVPKDLKGKIAVVLYGAPRSDRPGFFPTAASAVYSDGWVKSRLLKARGAVGLVVVLTPEVEQHLPWPFFVRQAPFEQMVWREGDAAGTGYAIPTARVPAAQLQRFLAKSGRNATDLFAAGPKGGLKPFPLGLRARLRTSAALRRLSSENVAGVLRGRERANEYVVLTAHLDHLGIGPPIDGDAIYNGAVDDAHGVSSVIEMARAFAALPARPPRSVLVLGVTGEEKGLLGSEYFAHHPTVPLAGIVADVNMDGGLGAWRPHDMVVLGAEHSTLERASRAALAASGLTLSPDPEPEQVFFIRSDQYSFVKKGIPAIFPGAGWKDERGEIAKNKATADWWTKHRYHHPKDEWDPSLDYENLAIEVRAVFLMALAVALDPDRPAWKEGDVFAKLFGAARRRG